MAALMDKEIREVSTRDQCVPGASNDILEQCIEETEETIEEVASSCSTDNGPEKRSSYSHETSDENEEGKTTRVSTLSGESVGVRLQTTNYPKRRKIEETDTVVLVLPAEEDHGSRSSVKGEVNTRETEFHDVVANVPVPRSCDEAVVPSFGDHEE